MKVALYFLVSSIVCTSSFANELVLPPGATVTIEGTKVTCSAAGPTAPGVCYGVPSTCYEMYSKLPVGELYIRATAGLGRCEIRQCTDPSECSSDILNTYHVYIDGRPTFFDYWHYSKDGAVKDLLEYIKAKRCD